MPDPQPTPLVLVERRDTAAQQARCTVRVIHHKADTVESHQAAICPQPQIAILRLHQRSHGTLWQAVIRAPYLKEIRRRRLLHRPHPQAPPQQKTDHAGPPPDSEASRPTRHTLSVADHCAILWPRAPLPQGSGCRASPPALHPAPAEQGQAPAQTGPPSGTKPAPFVATPPPPKAVLSSCAPFCHSHFGPGRVP